MSVPTMMIPKEKLLELGLSENININYQLSPEVLTQQAVDRGEGELNSTGALVINTGEFTGRSPMDKFIVKDSITENTVNWNNFNIPVEEKYFLQLRKKITDYLGSKDEVWVRDCYACANPEYRLNIRVVNERPWGNLFAYNMFLRPTEDELDNFVPDWQVIQAPGFKANPEVDGTRQHNFAMVSFKHKTIIIGGTGYTGETKKGIFTIL